MTLRDLQLPKDLPELAIMLSDSFQYPESPDWSVQDDERESLVDDINNLARSWWMIKIGQIFIPAMRDLLPGIVWEEENRIAGVVLVQRRGSSNHWVIGTVATRPEFRRKGIARRLVKAGLEFIRKKRGESAILDVIDANLPAYKLYESLGFKHFSSDLNLDFTPHGVHPSPEIDPDYWLESSSIFNWAPRYQLMKRISPESIQAFEPVEEEQFKQPGYLRLVLPLISRAQKMNPNLILIHHQPSQEIVGYLRYDIRTGGKGRHNITLRLDPAHAFLTPKLVEYMLNQATTVDSTLMIETTLPTWQQHAIDAMTRHGFEKRLLYHRMGLKL